MTFSLPVIPDDVRALDTVHGRFVRDEQRRDRYWFVDSSGRQSAASISLGALLDLCGQATAVRDHQLQEVPG